MTSIESTAVSPKVLAALLTESRLKKLSFTGSTPVGRELIRQSADNLLRTSTELGGKLRNKGEACTAANRFLIHEDVAEEFIAQIAVQFAGQRMGHGADPATTIGPPIDDAAVRKCADLVNDAIDRGARLVGGGETDLATGSFYAPTIIRDVPPEARILREQVFGPVAPIVTFKTMEEVVRLVNNTEYGLASYVFTRDLDRSVSFGEAVRAGMVGVNRGVLSNAAAPFGGIGASGFGREGGGEGIDEYLDTKYLAINRPDRATAQADLPDRATAQADLAARF